MQTPENLTMIAGFDITKLESIQLILIVTADEDQRRDKKSPYTLWYKMQNPYGSIIAHSYPVNYIHYCIESQGVC
jgi:hypothetical protein